MHHRRDDVYQHGRSTNKTTFVYRGHAVRPDSLHRTERTCRCRRRCALGRVSFPISTSSTSNSMATPHLEANIHPQPSSQPGADQSFVKIISALHTSQAVVCAHHVIIHINIRLGITLFRDERHRHGHAVMAPTLAERIIQALSAVVARISSDGSALSLSDVHSLLS
jgi:hypothetical protein